MGWLLDVYRTGSVQDGCRMMQDGVADWDSSYSLSTVLIG